MLKALNRVSMKLMAMDDAVWAPHANLWSGWSRVSILPLLALAVWSRVWIGRWAIVVVGAVLLWTWLNPRLFPAPMSIDNWMSQGALGERIWSLRADDPVLAHHASVISVLAAAIIVGALLLLAGSALLNVPLTTTGLAITMLAKLWLLDRMV
ncbi:MAG: DUF6653 family protein [Paracoccus sp. (in: a-proteobacteria)]|uniref:DUF6653 family protein n=1 Tax=Paracoccus sp. TaxID=267 RepID=UPI004058A9A3